MFPRNLANEGTVRVTESSHPEMFCKNGVLRNFANSHKTPVPGFLLNKVAGSDTGVFLRILRNFEERLFSHNTFGRLVLCFWDKDC